MAKEVKQIQCRVCGKLFTPCSYCSEHNDTFRWRNFACSIECAREYIAKVEAVRSQAKHESKAETPVVTPKQNKKKKFMNVETAVVPSELPKYEDVNNVDIEIE